MSFLDFAPAPESSAIVSLRENYGLFIGGEFREGSGGQLATVSPSTEEVLTHVAVANEADVDLAGVDREEGLSVDVVQNARFGAGEIPLSYRADCPRALA